MILILIIFGFFFLLALFPFLKYYVLHLPTCIKATYKDIKKYITHKEKNVCPYVGRIFMFVASGAQAFGSGKTLSMVAWLRMVYKEYNGLSVWDEENGCLTTQHIIIISNIELKDIPYIPFRGRDQFVNIDKLPHSPQDVIIFAIDEAGMEFNSREYKTNLPTDFLVRLLQCRHNRVSFCMTAQRFGFVDKLLRNCTGIVTTCLKRWRIVRLQEYDGYSLENATNPDLIQPLSTKFYFANDDLFNSYDTNYNVEKLKQQLEDGDLLDTEEILNRIQQTPNIEGVQNKLRKKYRSKEKR